MAQPWYVPGIGVGSPCCARNGLSVRRQFAHSHCGVAGLKRRHVEAGQVPARPAVGMNGCKSFSGEWSGVSPLRCMYVLLGWCRLSGVVYHFGECIIDAAREVMATTQWRCVYHVTWQHAACSLGGAVLRGKLPYRCCASTHCCCPLAHADVVR
jgi:hypothetical protein